MPTFKLKYVSYPESHDSNQGNKGPLANGGEGDERSKERLMRIAQRKFRQLKMVPFIGDKESGLGILPWFFRKAALRIVLYVVYVSAIWTLSRHGIFMYTLLELPRDDTYTPYLLSLLELLTAFLTGFGLTEAIVRYQAANSAIIDFMDNVENLRVLLLSSTDDPKFRYGVQVFISWLVVGLRQKITFQTEDFAKSIAPYIPKEMHDCVVFEPEVLYSCGRAQHEYLFHCFLRNAKLDQNQQLSGSYDAAITSLNKINELLMSKPPKTKAILTDVVCEIFLVLIPLVNRDFLTILMLPVMAAVFLLINAISSELSDPWNEGPHDIPLKQVLEAISAPVWFEGDHMRVKDSMMWFNRGLMENMWDHPGNPELGLDEQDVARNAIPRQKCRGEGKGSMLTFDDTRSVPEVTGHLSWRSFQEAKQKDMKEAVLRQRRMPYFLCWKDWIGLSWEQYMNMKDVQDDLPESVEADLEGSPLNALV
mmetsp:Transcript_99837/g.183075  ORF Transcript_99837/g.183075 Transcript_99837/m.183075 type:complete len:479 (-) Transcript_99837:351-1787(-)